MNCVLSTHLLPSAAKCPSLVSFPVFPFLKEGIYGERPNKEAEKYTASRKRNRIWNKEIVELRKELLELTLVLKKESHRGELEKALEMPQYSGLSAPLPRSETLHI